MATYADFDSRLVPRIRGLLELFEQSTTIDGTNPDLADLREWAFRAAGKVPASGIFPQESDFATLDSPTFWKMVDLAEYRALASAFNNWTEVTVRVSQGQTNESDLRNSWGARLEALEGMAHVQAAMGLNSVTGGEVVLDDFIAPAEPSSWYWGTP